MMALHFKGPFEDYSVLPKMKKISIAASENTAVHGQLFSRDILEFCLSRLYYSYILLTFKPVRKNSHIGNVLLPFKNIVSL